MQPSLFDTPPTENQPTEVEKAVTTIMEAQTPPLPTKKTRARKPKTANQQAQLQNVTVNIQGNLYPEKPPEIISITKPIMMRIFQHNGMFSFLFGLLIIMSFCSAFFALKGLFGATYAAASAALFSLTVPYFVFVIREAITVRIIAGMECVYTLHNAAKSVDYLPSYAVDTLNIITAFCAVFYVLLFVHNLYEYSSKWVKI